MSVYSLIIRLAAIVTKLFEAKNLGTHALFRTLSFMTDKRDIRSAQNELDSLVANLQSIRNTAVAGSGAKEVIVDDWIVCEQLRTLDQKKRSVVESLEALLQPTSDAPTTARARDIMRSAVQRYDRLRSQLRDEPSTSISTNHTSLYGDRATSADDNTALLNERVSLDLSLAQMDSTINTASAAYNSAQYQTQILNRVRKGTVRVLSYSKTANHLIDQIKRLECRQRLILLSTFSALIFLTLFYLYHPSSSASKQSLGAANLR